MPAKAQQSAGLVSQFVAIARASQTPFDHALGRGAARLTVDQTHVVMVDSRSARREAIPRSSRSACSQAEAYTQRP